MSSLTQYLSSVYQWLQSVTYNATPTYIAADSSDGSDSKGIIITGGGGTGGNTRGGTLTLYGNENGNAGSVTLTAGNVAGGDLYIQAPSGILNLTSASAVTFAPSGIANGGGLYILAISELLTIGVGTGAAGVTTSTNMAPSGVIVGLSARVTQAPGGGATTFSVGPTGGGNLDQFVQTASTALNTTAVYPTNGDGTTTLWVQKTATTLTVTTDVNVSTSNMIVRLTTYYLASKTLIS